MVYINEWLPNPTGLDTGGEWIELFNSEKNVVSLDGWKITSGDSKFSLSGKSIRAQGYLVLPRSETKLVLKNTDGKIFLYDSQGQLVGSAGFLGSAPEGKSYSRIGYETGAAQNFIFSEPTPGAQNKTPLETGLIKNNYPFGQPLNPPLGSAEFLGLLLGTAVVLTGLVMFVLKRNEDLSKLFFGGNEEIK